MNDHTWGDAEGHDAAPDVIGRTRGGCPVVTCPTHTRPWGRVVLEAGQ